MMKTLAYFVISSIAIIITHPSVSSAFNTIISCQGTTNKRSYTIRNRLSIQRHSSISNNNNNNVLPVVVGNERNVVATTFPNPSSTTNQQQQQQRNNNKNIVVPTNTKDDVQLKEMGKALEQRLIELAKLEQQLEERLKDLTRSETNFVQQVQQSRIQQQQQQQLPQQQQQQVLQQRQQQQLLQQQLLQQQQSRMAINPSSVQQKNTITVQPDHASSAKSIDKIWQKSLVTTVQGGSLRTWSFANPAVQRVHIMLKTDGRPLDADIELWQGPENTPHKMKVYIEDGGLRRFSTFIDTPRSPNTICIRNTGHLEFPLNGCVTVDHNTGDALLQVIQQHCRGGKGDIIQGGALRTYAFEPIVNSVAIMIQTDGRPLNARIELLQGPNNNKQVMAVYTENGLHRPFVAILQTPGSGNVVRVLNVAPVEFPMHATVVEHEILSTDDVYSNDGIQLGYQW